MKVDPDYLEFLKTIAKPAEHLPSAEIQLERREAEQAGLSFFMSLHAHMYSRRYIDLYNFSSPALMATTGCI